MKKVCGKLVVHLGAFLLCWNAGIVSAEVDEDFERCATAHRQGKDAMALECWRPLAEQGLINAQFNLGQMYRSGIGVPQNPALALEWLGKAAAQGDAQAQSLIGLMYLNGEGVPQNEAEAHKWFTMSHHGHLHHNQAQMDEWRKQARQLIQAAEEAEKLAAAKRDGEKILADLRASLAKSAAEDHSPRYLSLY